MSKMKIGVFTQHFFPENFRINFVVDELKKKNDVTIFTSMPHYNIDKNVINKYKNYLPYLKYEKKLKIWRFPIIYQKKNSFFKFCNYVSYILSLSFFSQIFLRKNFDIIFVYATSPIFQVLPAILYKLIKKKPLVIWVQDLWPEVLVDLKIPFNKQLSFLIRPIIEWIYNSSDLILCQSNSFVNSIKKIVKNKNKVVLYYNPSDIKNTLLRSRFKSKTFKILFAGNLGAAQNLEIVIKIAKIIKKNTDNIQINLVGNGNQFSLIKDLINKNKLDDIIKLHGYISVSKVKKYYQKADALLLTLHDGKALNKTIPAKFQTYLAYAKPILVSANGEINNLVKQKKLGLSSRAGYYNNLYINILRLKNMTKKEIDNISLNCIKFYKSDFMLAKNVSYLQKILNKLI